MIHHGPEGVLREGTEGTGKIKYVARNAGVALYPL